REQSLREMQSALQEWTDTHQGLQQGSETLRINGDKSNKIEELLKPVTSHHQRIMDAAEAIVQKLAENADLPPEGIQAEIETITTYEGEFLRDMDLLVLQYENEAKAKVINLK